MGSTLLMAMAVMGILAGTTVAAFVSPYAGVFGATVMSFVAFFIAAFMPGTFEVDED